MSLWKWSEASHKSRNYSGKGFIQLILVTKKKKRKKKSTNSLKGLGASLEVAVKKTAIWRCSRQRPVQTVRFRQLETHTTQRNKAKIICIQVYYAVILWSKHHTGTNFVLHHIRHNQFLLWSAVHILCWLWTRNSHFMKLAQKIHYQSHQCSTVKAKNCPKESLRRHFSYDRYQGTREDKVTGELKMSFAIST